jgi:hypothetical protein
LLLKKRSLLSPAPSFEWSPFEGFDDAHGANSTHSEQKAHKFVLDSIGIYRKYKSWEQVTGLTVVFYSQVQVCKECKIDMRSWRNDYQRAAGGKPVDVTIWEHAHFFIKTPSTGKVTSEEDVVMVTIQWDPTPSARTSALTKEQAFSTMVRDKQKGARSWL